jgi:biopolymer transport protein ExbD
MAEKRRFLDVWLVEPNTVYREVPYTVVADWVQQSRLLPDDMLRPSGTAQWFRVGESPEFTPYIPKADAVAIEDEASAREGVSLDFNWKKRRDEDDDDVDMIPLIDVSMVLLVFFMLTSTVASAAALINTPPAEHGLVIGKSDMIFINVDFNRKLDPPERFAISVGEGDPAPDDKDLLTVGEVKERLEAKLLNRKDEVEITIRANGDIESGIIRDLSVELTKIRSARIKSKFVAVSEEPK